MFDFFFLPMTFKYVYLSFVISFIFDILRRITTVYERHSVFSWCCKNNVTSEIKSSDGTFNVACELYQFKDKPISIFLGGMVWIEKSVTRITDRHHEAWRLMPNSDPE